MLIEVTDALVSGRWSIPLQRWTSVTDIPAAAGSNKNYFLQCCTLHFCSLCSSFKIYEPDLIYPQFQSSSQSSLIIIMNIMKSIELQCRVVNHQEPPPSSAAAGLNPFHSQVTQRSLNLLKEKPLLAPPGAL